MLYKDIAKYVRILTILALWTATFYISGNLFGGDVVLPTPFTKQNIVSSSSDFNIGNFTTQNQEMPIIFSKYVPERADLVNCAHPCDRTADDESIFDWMDRGIACPMEIPHYTKIRIGDLGIFTCVDKGGWIKIVQEGERDDALTNSQRYFNVQNNVGDPNVVVYAEETHMWVDLMTTEANLEGYPDYKTLIYDWEIIDDTITIPLEPVSIPIQTLSCHIQEPYDNDVLSQGIHGSDYSPPQPNSLDYGGGKGVNVLSPISGVVTVNEIRYFGVNNEYGNTTIIIENDCYSILMYHGDWVVSLGQEVEMGEVVGTEGNNGYTFDEYDNYCGTGSSCGYHTHMYTFDKILGVGIDPRERYTE